MTAHLRCCVLIVACLCLPAISHAQSTKPTVFITRLPNGFIIPLALVVPETVTLSKQQYQDLLAKLERLQALLDNLAPQGPRECDLEIRTEARGRQAVAKIKATFKLFTERPRTTVFLGCKSAQAVEAKWLGNDTKPALVPTDDGLAVQIDTPGEHVLVVELEAAIGPRGTKGTELGFDLGLPAAAITKLAVEAPANVKRFTLTTKTVRDKQLVTDSEQVDAERFPLGKGGYPLGAVTTLQLLWDDPKAKVELPRSVESDIGVVVGDDEIVTTAKLRLRGSGTEWRFVAPSSADVTVTRWSNVPNPKTPLEFAADRAPNLVRPEPGQQIWKLQFRDPPTTDVLVTVVVRSLRPRANDPKAKSPLAIGPFDVLDVPKQNGILRVKTPPNVRPVVQLKGDTRRDPDEEGSYRYTRLTPLNSASKDPYFDLVLQPYPGSVSSRVRHELRLHELGWRIRSEISLAPTRTEIEQLELEVPATFQPLQGEPRDLVEGLSTSRDPNGKTILRVRLTAPKTTSFNVTIEGEYRVPPKGTQGAFALPSLLGVQTRDHEVLVFPPANYDVRGTLRPLADPAKPSTWTVPLEWQLQEREPRLRATLDVPAASIDLTWKPTTTGVSVRSVCDVDWLAERALVTQRLTYRFTGKPPAKVHLVGERPLPTPRSNVGAVELAGDGWDVSVPADVVRDWSVTLTYLLPLPGLTDGPKTLNILRPTDADTNQRVRLWTGADTTLTLADGETTWTNTATEIVEERPNLPDLVLLAHGTPTAPVVQVTRRPTDALAPVDSERGWFDVVCREGLAYCRMQWELTRWTDAITLVLPARAKNVEVAFLGKTLKMAEAGTTDNQRQWRVALPATTTRPALLDVRYELPLDAIAQLQAPTIEHAAGPTHVQWALRSAPGTVPLLYGGRVQGAWSVRAFLNDWNVRRVWNRNDEPTDIVLHTGSQGSVRYTSVPRGVWLFGCSLVVFLVGLGIGFAKGNRRRFMVLALILVVFVGGVYAAPLLARVLGGAGPGLLALVVLGLLYRLMTWRYQRRLARLPSFARGTTTLVRPSKVRAESSAGNQPVLVDPS